MGQRRLFALVDVSIHIELQEMRSMCCFESSKQSHAHSSGLSEICHILLY